MIGANTGQPHAGIRLQRKLAALLRPNRRIVAGEAVRGMFGSTEVTPDNPLPLFGFAFRQDRPFSSVMSSLELNAAVLRRRDRCLVLLTGDFLYLSGTLRDAIVRTYGMQHGFSQADVLLGASHTHFAPSLDVGKPGLGAADEGYIAFVHAKALALLGQLLEAKGEPITVRHCRRTSRHNCNRRSVVFGADGELAVDDIMSDPGNVFDDALDVVRFDGADGGLRGAMVRYACHPISFPEKLAVTAEFPGVIRSEFRASSGIEELPVLFFQGFAGDMVPMSPPREAPDRTAVRGGLKPVKREATLSADEWQRWTASLASDAHLALDEAERACPAAPQLGARERRLALSELIDGLSEEHRDSFLSMQAIWLCADLLIVALSAEPTAAWTERIGDLAPGMTVLPVGYVNQTYGYLPAARELAPNGYMAGGFFEPFGLRGCFRSDLEQRVVSELELLLAPFVRIDAEAYRQRLATLRAQVEHLRSERELARASYLKAEAQSAAGPPTK